MKDLLLLYCVIALTACNTSKSATDDPGGSEKLYMYRWELTALNGNPFEKSDRMDPHLLLRSEDHKVTGSPGCNHLTGSFKLSDEDRIKFSTMVTTKMACPDNGLEYQFLEAIGKATHWSVMNSNLSLKAGDETIAQFKGVKRPTG